MCGLTTWLEERVLGMDNNFRNDQTVYVDMDISREAIEKMAKTRPFIDFINFPINVNTMLDEINKPFIVPKFCSCDKPDLKNSSGACGCNWCNKCDGKITCVRTNTYTLPKNGDYTEKIPIGETVGLPVGIEITDYIEVDSETVAFAEKILEKKKSKETYISPFTGRVM